MRQRRSGTVVAPSDEWFWDRRDGTDECGTVAGAESGSDVVDLTDYHTSARETELERYGELSRESLDAAEGSRAR